MGITEAAEACGLSAHTIRFYEKSGMLPEIERGTDGHRRIGIVRIQIKWFNFGFELRRSLPSAKTICI